MFIDQEWQDNMSDGQTIDNLIFDEGSAQEMFVSEFLNREYFPKDEEYPTLAIFWNPRDSERNGFKLAILRFVSCQVDADPKKPETFDYEIIASMAACYDGVRHLQFGDKGYINYPNLPLLADIFKRVRELEIEFGDKDLLD